jgi:hypothetical protein
MPILKSMGLGQLQTIQHVLQEMEGEGAVSLSEARGRIVTEINSRPRHRLLGKSPVPAPTSYCPQCRYPLSPVITGDSTAVVLGCRNCRWSKIVEGDDE